MTAHIKWDEPSMLCLMACNGDAELAKQQMPSRTLGSIYGRLRRIRRVARKLRELTGVPHPPVTDGRGLAVYIRHRLPFADMDGHITERQAKLLTHQDIQTTPVSKLRFAPIKKAKPQASLVDWLIQPTTHGLAFNPCPPITHKKTASAPTPTV